MNKFEHLWKLGSVVMLTLGLFTACETTDSEASASAYYGVGFYDPWYYGDYHQDVDIIVPPPSPGRPPGDVGAHPEHPIAKPPSAAAPRPQPLPSIPSASRPMVRPAGRR